MKKVIFPFLSFLFLLSCSKEQKNAESTLSVVQSVSPASSRSATPYLFTDKNNTTYLSWTEKTDSMNLFKYAKLESGAWTTSSLITSGNTWFVNWADYPMIVADGSDNLIAHLLNKNGESTYAYDVKMFASDDGGESWENSFVLHDDGKQAEHGFVSLVPFGENIFVAWLDGRNTVTEGMAPMGTGMQGHEGHGQGAMSLRGAVMDYQGNKIEEWELDNKTCDCCQTSAAITSNGPVVVYRDRSDEEIRDMSIVRLVNGTWTKPKTIFPDNWKIAGCPVNGPRADAIGNSLTIAWFGMVDEQSQVKIIFSQDGGGTFDEPIRIDEGKAIGRVDVVMLDADNAMVSWMEGTDIKAVKVNRNGTKESPIVIATSSESRSSGFPQMTKSGNELIFAWTDDEEKKVKTAIIKL